MNEIQFEIISSKGIKTMNQNKIERYQDIYRELWEAQVKKDRNDNPRLNTISPNYKKRKPYISILKLDKTPIPYRYRVLSKQAETINMLLLRGFGVKDISPIIHTSEKAIRIIKDRYNLPRKN
tara:strand:- start:340 stop:708 length:369 start_codon:yes stop_codon:yes gene_type:complete